jgi:hypothetical protein
MGNSIKEDYVLVFKNGVFFSHVGCQTWEQMKKECKKHGLEIDFIKEQPKKLIIEL